MNSAPEMTPEEAELHLLFRGYGVSKTDLHLNPPPGCTIQFKPEGDTLWNVLQPGKVLPAGSRVRLVPTKDMLPGNRADRRKRLRQIHKAMRSSR